MKTRAYPQKRPGAAVGKAFNAYKLELRRLGAQLERYRNGAVKRQLQAALERSAHERVELGQRLEGTHRELVRTATELEGMKVSLVRLRIDVEHVEGERDAERRENTRLARHAVMHENGCASLNNGDCSCGLTTWKETNTRLLLSVSDLLLYAVAMHEATGDRWFACNECHRTWSVGPPSHDRECQVGRATALLSASDKPALGKLVECRSCGGIAAGCDVCTHNAAPPAPLGPGVSRG